MRVWDEGCGCGWVLAKPRRGLGLFQRTIWWIVVVRGRKLPIDTPLWISRTGLEDEFILYEQFLL